MARQIIVHGHFYQPPRENPWTGRIDPQPSAAPFPNWNERVNAECYRPNAHSVLPGPDGEYAVNNFERISFNVGPTLMQWLEGADPETHRRILDADRESASRLGHGNALAQAYHHTILPLSPARDVRTQVRWGLADFRARFGRPARGMWLPETAADDSTLAVLIEEGLGFTILAPRQAGSWREEGGEWVGAETEPVDARVAYRYMHHDGSGRSLALFFYDGDISQAIAFENAGSSAEGFIEMFAERGEDGCFVVHAATDGETYGHHHRFSDLGLAYALFVVAPQRGVETLNYAAFLERCPPRHEATIVKGEGTSWSCAHGVARWKDDCGCATGGEPGWNQAWRAPLRAALEILGQAADDAFERLGRMILSDPWAARDRYIEVVIGSMEVDDFVRAEAGGPLTADRHRAAIDLLEMQRNAMAMFTSCGWFFNDISGIETLQVLRYAKRTMELLAAVGGPVPEERFLSELARAESNDPDAGTGAEIFRGL